MPVPTEDPCVLCGGTARRFVVTGYDRMAPRAGSYPYWRCDACGLIARAPLPAPEQIPELYPADYQRRIESWTPNLDKPVNRLAVRYFYGVDSVDQPRWVRAAFRVLSGRILRGLYEPYGRNRLLDVGCGAGAQLALYQRLGWKTAGIDVDDGALALGRQRGLTLHHGSVFDAPYGPEFDVVLLSHVIEHVRDPVAVLARAAEFLAPRGKMIVVTPNIRSLGFALFGSCWYPLDAPRHLALFSPSTLRAAAARARLRVRRLRTAPESRLLCTSWRLLRTQGAMLPEDAAERRRRVEQSASGSRPAIFRQVAVPMSLASAAIGRGELLEAELVAT
jgi:SAM-dependent methyltransferase